jgi:hypothetical protein
MGSNTSRGSAISGYFPVFAGPSGVKVYHDNLKCQTLSGTAISANIVYAVSHQLGVVPKFVDVIPRLTKAQAASAVVQNVALAAAASATTSAKVYICANGKGIKYDVFIIA